jgi:ABC-2 type transport system permease protein
MVLKEFVQMRRDRLTFAVMVGIPIIQLIVFGYAINSDPRHLPTAVVAADYSPVSRSLIYALRSSGYFNITHTAGSEEEARRLLEMGQVQFVVNIPPGFYRRMVRGERPPILVEADATDPAATSNAVAAVSVATERALARDLPGSLDYLRGTSPVVDVRVHALYNPEGVTQYNIVPGLIGVILTMTMVMMTALAMTRERERGTLENLLALPVRPLEVMVGKILPYIVVGYIQAGLILAAARLLFNVPMLGSLLLLALVMLLFIAANLVLGLTFSTVARNQLQAMQMTFFFFLPSILLSGFMFPFRGMPQWAQVIGEVLPLTHFLRLVRGILLKGYGPLDVWPNLWPILAFMLLVLAVGRQRYRETLD